MLKIVRTPSFFRTAATCRIAGCMSGAKQKQMPSSSRQRSTCGMLASMFTPSSASTSAEPLRLVTLRLPCLATGTPPAAMTSAAVVLMLKTSLPPPPVPQVSSSWAYRLRMGVMWARIARGGAGDFFRRLALRGQRGKEEADLTFVALARHEGVDRRGHLLGVEIFARSNLPQQSYEVVRHSFAV